MNLTISKEQIMNGLQAVQNVVSTRTTLPVLSNVLLRAEGDLLELTATDLDVTICCSVEAKVKKAGTSTVPVKRLFGIIRELGTGDIDISVDEKNFCSVQSGPSFYKINGLGADEFPPVQELKEEKKLVLPQETVRGMMKRTSFAVSTDETRHSLNGIYLSMKDHKLTMVATDGRRLALADEEVDIPDAGQGECIIPSKAVGELNRLLQDKGEVEIRYTETLASFRLRDDKTASVLIITKLVEGNYPDYRRVIPAESKERVALQREEFMLALRRAEIMTSEKANSVKLSFGKNRLEITANSPEVGEAKESLAVNYKGPDMAIAFNPRFMIDPLSVLPNDEVYLELTDELSPGVLKINGPFLYVVMPMRLS
jgi:DNA polymerase-3 subunit beta